MTRTVHLEVPPNRNGWARSRICETRGPRISALGKAVPCARQRPAHAQDHKHGTEEKGRGVETLGAEMVGKLSHHHRWIVVFANILFQKQPPTPEELALRMGEAKARSAAYSSSQAAASLA